MKELQVTIKATFGSDFQRQAAMHGLSAMMKSWKEFYLEKHKGTKIDIRVDDPNLK